MVYDVIVTDNAKEDFDNHLAYLLYNLKNEQAYNNLLNDYDETIEELSGCAGSLNYCLDPDLAAEGYKSINFVHLKYYMLYRIEGNLAIVEAIRNNRQDPKNWKH